MKSTIAKAKRLMALLAVCTAAVAAGCAGPEERSLSPETFTATIEQEGATKTVLDAKTGTPPTRQVRWQDGDKIALYGASADYTMAGLVSTGSTAAYFTGSGATQDGGKYKAYYPASIYNKTTKKLTFREEQDYGGLSGGKAVVSNLPMYAESATTELDFKNLCSVLNFQLTGEATDKVTEIVVTTSAAGQYLSGEFTIGGTPASAPTMVMTGAAGSTNTVKLKCGSGVALSSTPVDFFVAIPAQTYAAGTLTITVKDGTKTLATLSNSTATAAQEQFQRNTIYEIAKQAEEPVFSVTHSGTTTPSTGTNVDVDRTATAITFNADTLHFAVTTNLGGYTVEILDAGMNVNATIVPNPPSSNTSGDDLSAPVVVSNNLNLSSFTDPGLTVFEPFSVAAGHEIFFSPGNLQYQASADGVTPADNWRFAPHQWEWVGDDSYGNVYTSSTAKSTNTVEPESAREFYTGWIDLFGWGATGQQYSTSASHKYQPWAYGGTASDYGPSGSVDLSGQSDWGYNMGGGYRTPSRTEWAYLVNTRGSGSTYMRYMRTELDFAATDRTFYVRFKAKDDDQYSVTYKFTQEKGPNVYGLILFPDDFATKHATEAALCAGSYNNNTIKKLSTADWLTLQGAGCVFLPQTGGRTVNNNVGVYEYNRGKYWASTCYGSGSGYFMYFNAVENSLGFNAGSSIVRSHGCAVRLVRGEEFTGDTEPYQPGGNSGF